MKKNKNILISLLIPSMVFMNNMMIVNADSGLESNYKDSSLIGVIIEAVMNCGSLILKLIATNPGDEDYTGCYIITAIICVVLFYIFTSINIFKLDKKDKNAKQVLILLAISLIPTCLFSLLCLLIKTYLIMYFIIIIVYIVILTIVMNIIVKNKLNKQLINAKVIDKTFNEDEFNKEAFDVYKKVQLAWIEFDLKSIKDIISNKLYITYDKKLNELKDKNQKNVMSDIEYESNKIIYVNINNNMEEVICEMKVVCHDYITEGDKVIKGEKDKKYHYKYKLYFSKNLKNNKLVLDNKKLISTKVEK